MLHSRQNHPMPTSIYRHATEYSNHTLLLTPMRETWGRRFKIIPDKTDCIDCSLRIVELNEQNMIAEMLTIEVVTQQDNQMQ